MKQRTIKVLPMMLGAIFLAAFPVFGNPQGSKMSVKGEVVDLWCYSQEGAHGPAHRQCGMTCARLGNPIGIVDAEGNIYVAMGAKDHQPGRALLLDKMSQTVTVTGTLVEKGGLKLLYISTVK
ncbi:MAG: hypothetical protein EPN47_18240 [Acidobacteria bacterium]|nr:MAG: hypothetical protein EPN47_18240 [Acidobacteriota bacterium]